jgi:hypothetical protein
MSPGGSMGYIYALQLLLSENRKIVNNPTTTKATEKISAGLESLEFYKNSYARLTKFKGTQILVNKISDQFQVTPKLFNG